MKILNSPTEQITFDNKHYFVKRDDLLDVDFTGNKARKFYYFFKNTFPDIDTIVSYGSNQSNAMYSLSVLAKIKGWNFIYYTNHLPSFLKQNPQGNYKAALQNGMKLVVGNYNQDTIPIKQNELFIYEGGAIKEAAYGIEILANEIKQWKKEKNLQEIKVFLPSGTGTTALFLQKYLEDEVLTTPCVGDKDYLKQQFYDLEQNDKFHPTIVPLQKKFHFGKLYKENYTIWQRLLAQTSIEFDLLYDPIGWQLVLQYENRQNLPILYIHQGGIKGNETMKLRYERKQS